MVTELLFFEKEDFSYYKEYVNDLGKEIVSISPFMRKTELINEMDLYNKIIDISVLNNYKEKQFLGENLLIDKFEPFDDVIFIADKQYEEEFKYTFRYSFSSFNDITIPVNYLEKKESFEIYNDKVISKKNKHKKIINLSDNQLLFFKKQFNEKLYGHEKFKDNFYNLIKSFKVFNKLGEHKILSIFLLGESGVGKTEVARIIHKCLNGTKKLAKINFGNYSNENSLSSLIGSSRGYINSEDGEIFKRVRETDVGVILIDEFEKSNVTLFNYFLDVLESGKMVSSLADEIDLNGFIIIFTSNISLEDFRLRISPELRSRFDYIVKFTTLKKEDKENFVKFRITDIVNKYNISFDDKLSISVIDELKSQINVETYNNMRDLNKEIKKRFVQYLSENEFVATEIIE